jgi:hypothetical protein
MHLGLERADPRRPPALPSASTMGDRADAQPLRPYGLDLSRHPGSRPAPGLGAMLLHRAERHPRRLDGGRIRRHGDIAARSTDPAPCAEISSMLAGAAHLVVETELGWICWIVMGLWARGCFGWGSGDGARGN